MTEAIARQGEQKVAVTMDHEGVQIRDISEAWRVCTAMLKSGVVPQSLNTVEKVFVAMQTGMELGFSPSAAVRSVYVINGAPSLTGQAALALMRRYKGTKTLTVDVVGDGDKRAAVVTLRRDGMADPVEVSFSLAEAKAAQLTGKGPWKSYLDDMLTWRAVSRAAKRYFSDVLLGIEVAEVAEEYQRGPSPRVLPEAPPPAEPDPLMAEEDEPPALEVDPDTGQVRPRMTPDGKDELQF